MQLPGYTPAKHVTAELNAFCGVFIVRNRHHADI